MKLLLTSSGIADDALLRALEDLLGTPVVEASALVVPVGILPFTGGPQMAARLLRGEAGATLTGLGWASLGLLDLPALPSIRRDVWLPALEAADALLVWGGDPLFVSHWLRESELADLLPTLDLVYVGVSAGAIATAAVFGETYTDPLGGAGTPLSSEEVVFTVDGEEVPRTLHTAAGAGFVDVAVIPHYLNPNHPDASRENAELWAARIPAVTYAIDERTALRVVDGVVDVVGDGEWRRFEPS